MENRIGKIDDRKIAAKDRRGDLGTYPLRRARHYAAVHNPYGFLNSRYTVAASVEEPLLLHKTGGAASRRRRVQEVLNRVALPRLVAERLPHELSGGQRQRVAIARARVLSPDPIILDEAVSALGVIVQAQILALLVALQREFRLSYLFISHDLAVVRMLAHDVHIMHKGRIVESGMPEPLFAHPTKDDTRQLLSAIPRRAAAR